MLRPCAGAGLLVSVIFAGSAACSSDPADAADAAVPAVDARAAADASGRDGEGLDASEIADASLDAADPTDAASLDAADPADAARADATMTTPRTVTTFGALGSSSAAGSGASAPELAFVRLLHARLEGVHAPVTLLNRAQGGARIDTLLAALPDLERARPELVVILPLTDFVQTDDARFQSGYDELFRRLGAVGTTVFFGDVRIDPAFLCQGGMSGPGGCYGEEDRALLDRKNAIIRDLTRVHTHVIVVPVFDQNAAHPEWNAADGHPNDRGHLFLADTFWAAIEPWLAGR